MDEVSTAMDAKRVKTTSVPRRIRVNQSGAKLHRFNRCATVEQKAVEMKDKVHTVQKNRLRSSNREQHVLQTVQQFQAAEEVRTNAARKPQLRQAAKEVAERNSKV